MVFGRNMLGALKVYARNNSGLCGFSRFHSCRLAMSPVDGAGNADPDSRRSAAGCGLPSLSRPVGRRVLLHICGLDLLCSSGAPTFAYAGARALGSPMAQPNWPRAAENPVPHPVVAMRLNVS